MAMSDFARERVFLPHQSNASKFTGWAKGSVPTFETIVLMKNGGPGANAPLPTLQISRGYGVMVWTAPYGINCARMRLLRSQTREPSMDQIIRIGMDTSKHFF